MAWLVKDSALEEMNKGGLWKVPKWFFRLFHQFLTPVYNNNIFNILYRDYAVAGNFKIIPSYMAGNDNLLFGLILVE